MSNIEIGFLGLGLTLLLIVIKIPIGVVLGVVAFGGIAVLTNLRAAWSIASSIPYDFISDWNLSAVPTFLLMGFIASEAGLSRGLFTSIRVFFGRVPGGLASATVMASAMFASASGSSVATAAAFSRIAVPEMLRVRYNPGLATGSVAAAGTLGSLIPPSILMIIFGIFTQTSISKLFMAGVLPGLLSATVFIVMITIRCWLNPSLAPREQVEFSRADRVEALKNIWILPLLVILVLGGILLGIFSPTEAGAVGAFTAALFGFARRALTFNMLKRSLVQACTATSAIFFVGIGAAIYVRFLGLSQVPTFVADVLFLTTENPLILIAMISVLIIILGMFVDSLAIMLLTIPVILPLLTGFGIDKIWFGIIMIKLLEIGLITPPVGLNIFVIQSSLGKQVPLATIFHGVFWFFLMELLILTILIIWPQISLWLPHLLR